MKFAVAVLIGATAAVRIHQTNKGDDFEAEAKQMFDYCAGGDGSLSKGEAIACAKKHGHGDKVGDIKEHWPKDKSGKDVEVTFDDLKKAYEEHTSLAQGDDSDMSEGEAKAIFDKCAGDDGSLSLKEALTCAKESGHGKHAKGMKKHWPKDA